MGCKDSKPNGDKNHRTSINPKNVDNTDRPHKQNKDYEVKISFLGNIAVGKTCYYLQTKDDMIHFKNQSTEPSGANAVKHLETQKYGKILAVLWDTAGEETFFAVTATLIKKSNAVMLLYAIDNRESFAN